MPKGLSLVLLIILLGSLTQAQDLRQTEIKNLIDQPTAGLLKKGEYGFDARFYAQGGMLAFMGVGLFDRFMIGLSYGGVNVIGRGEVAWNELPGVLVKYRLFEETDLPAVVFGFDNQGHGLWLDDQDRYEIKAKGFYAVASKNWRMGTLGTLGLHGGVNYNTIEDQDDPNLNGFFGLDKSLNDQISLICEYNLGLDDNNDIARGENRGYLNAGLRWTFARQLGIEFHLMDLLGNSQDFEQASRELRITYVETF